jgi:hypothetical protein
MGSDSVNSGVYGRMMALSARESRKAGLRRERNDSCYTVFVPAILEDNVSVYIFPLNRFVVHLFTINMLD